MIKDQNVSLDLNGKISDFQQGNVEAEVNGTVGTLIFSNEAKRNALNLASWLAVPKAVSWLLDQNVRAIVAKGAGVNFCAGADISEFDTVRKDPASARNYEQSNIEAFASLRSAPVPTIASIRGFCLGGGFGLAAACDLRLAETGSALGVPAARLGLGYPVDAMADIVQSIGVQNTKRLLFTANRYSSEEMLNFGFLNSVEASGGLDQAVGELCNQIVELAPLTHRATKAAILASFHGDKEAATELSDATFDSADYAEGRTAFREKRKPVFKGN